ncbi:carboxypeptidase-like regulatory domain-containing protein [Flavobacterium sp. '19STA2R22 D10 B1']|uniref:carboxypeptidase-like regulatory domain-containing protein n=1 Tax=Flavobacterium aerium TaxID=3037261 RepID=UPI00278BB89D|nr:carboxypeptidase-like regulatory domain-containing protein [Flavobacterium sp. '19STA2R22 D10 B1']
MRYFVVFFFLLLSATVFSQETISGTIVNDNTSLPMGNVNIINLNLVKGTISNEKGNFELEARVNDTLHISFIGFQSIRVRVTNDWMKAKTAKIRITERAYALEEVIIKPYDLTGYLEVDSKLIPLKENYRFSISGLPAGYEAGEYAPGAFSKVIGSIFNPADLLYNVFGKKPAELKKLKEMKKDDTVRNLLQSKFDRETLAALLGVSKKDIADILERCNYSEAFIKTANDLQIMDAISGCYEEYKILKRN